MKKAIAIAVAVAPLAIAAPALASDDDDRCPDLAADQWMSIADVASKLDGMGYQIREIERERNCYEVEGVDANGARFEAYVDPATGDILPPRERRS